MLVALTENGEHFVCTSDLPRSVLKQKRNTTQFYCPHCKEQVQLKVGEVKVPHFAHLANSRCAQMFSEGESEIHLQGKEQLYKMFQRLKLQVELECYLTELAQRPDLLVTDQFGRRFAIEFQCSPISQEQIRKRTKGYLSAKITPIWIFLTPSKKSTSIGKIQKLSLSPMLQQMICGTNAFQQFIMTYNPTTQHFLYFSNLFYLHGNAFITRCLQLSVHQQQFPLYEPAPLQKQYISEYAKIYSNYRQQFAYIKMMTNKKGVNDPFLRACYELQFSSKSLPSYVGIPVADASAISLFSVEWQVRLLYYCLQNQLGLHVFGEQDIVDFLQWLGVPNTSSVRQAVRQYIAYYKKVLFRGTRQQPSLESYMVNELQSNWKIGTIKE